MNTKHDPVLISPDLSNPKGTHVQTPAANLPADVTRIGDFCAPGTIYANMDDAVNAACCMSSQHPKGATVYCTTEDVLFDSGEAYIVAIDIRQSSTGLGWDVPPAPYEGVYTITRHKDRA